MAENKKSFVLYADLIGNIDHLTNEEKGILFNHLLEYVNDKKPILEDRLILTAWKPIERQLKRDLLKYEETKEERSKSGQLGNLKRYNLDLYEKVKSEDITLKEAQRIAKTRIAEQSETKLAVNDNVNVNVNDSVNVSTNVDVEEKADDVFLNIRKNYKGYANQLYKDELFINSIAKDFMPNKSRLVIMPTLKKYLGLYLNRLDQDKKVHNNKKQFMEHFPNWLRKQTITFIYPKETPTRYF